MFDDYTDLNLFKDALFDGSDLFIVCGEGSDLLVEVNYDDKLLNIVSNGEVKFINKVESLHSDELFDELAKIGVGEYKFLHGLKFVKN
ncbi:hypothetical protein [uncultured Methanobrevibacter sp.]|uniref:hypothetical protein n=1 Tax=uncultured Methanobrevibacter sp. TaxID=253161 RepID=UPI0025EE5D11|nr:hypothetical protein [uncultured Methanobrevibacter sp.]